MRKRLIAGIDEAGRGPIAGPVCVGLVIMNKASEKFLLGIKDSKKLSRKKREEWFRKLKELKKAGRLNFTYAMVSAGVIDKIGIVGAIQRAVNTCCTKCVRTKCARSDLAHLVLDGGLKAPPEFKNQKTIIKGDEKVAVIAAASIVAKVMRDRRMVKLAEKYSKYGFEKHKGYGTKGHYKNIKKNGISPLHRKTFIK